jgi:hypothetical protein
MKYELQNVGEPLSSAKPSPTTGSRPTSSAPAYSAAPSGGDLDNRHDFRDGQQSRPPYSVEEVVEIFKFMNRIGGTRGLIRQSEFFLYGETDRAAVEACQKLGFKFPEITAWIRAVKKDFELVKAMGLKEPAS